MTPVIKGLLTGLVLATCLALLTLSPTGQRLEESLGLYTLFKWRGHQDPPNDVAIVSIDKASTDTLQLPRLPRKWSRALHGELVQRLKEAGAKLIVFDLVFSEPRDAAGDRVFIDAVRQAGNVMLVESVNREITAVPGAKINVEQLLPPIDALRKAALDTAPFPLPVRPVRLNEFWSFKPSLSATPTMPTVALLHFYREYVPHLLKLLSQAGYRLSAFQIKRQLTQVREQSRRHPDFVNRLRWLLQQEEQRLAPEQAYAMKAMVAALTGFDRRYIHYYGPPRTIPTLPYAAVVDGFGQWDINQLSAAVSGKVVFVGFSQRQQPVQEDNFYTVYSQADGLDISGVEIAATVFANLLADETLQAWPPMQQFLLIVLWGVFLIALIRWFSIPFALFTIAALSAAYAYIAYWVFDEFVVWLPLVMPLLVQVPLTLIVGYVWRYHDSRVEHRRIRKAFGFYIPDDVVSQLVRDGEIQSGGNLVHGVCLATDASQYTALAEQLEPIELSDLMNEYYRHLFQPVRDNGGFVSDVVGDAMLAIWVTGQQDETMRSLACKAALGIDAGVASFNRMHADKQLPTRLGLHCGDMVLGNIGAVDHFEYRAVGDVVNTATRIQGMNKHLGTRQLVSGEIAESAGEFLYRDLGEFFLAGRSRPIQVLELMGVKDAIPVAVKDRTDMFDECIAVFYEQNWQRAKLLLNRFLQNFPHDGPALFYLEQCEHYQRQMVRWEGAVAMSQK